MTPLKTRGLWMDRQTHLGLVEYAWLHRTTMGDVVRAVLDNIRSGGTDASTLAVPDRPGRVKLSVKSSDEQWDGAVSAAAVAGVPFNSLVRRHIIKALMEEGLLE